MKPTLLLAAAGPGDERQDDDESEVAARAPSSVDHWVSPCGSGGSPHRGPVGVSVTGVMYAGAAAT